MRERARGCEDRQPALLCGLYYNYDAASNRYFKFDYRDPVHPITSYYTFDGPNVLTSEKKVQP